MPSEIHHDLLIEGRRRLESAAYGTKSAVVEQLAAEWHLSPQRVRYHLRQVGYTTGRRRRADAGRSELVTLPELREMALFLFHSQRRTGKILGDISLGCEVLRKSGRISERAAGASPATWNRLLASHGLSKRHLKAPALATELDAAHPNHVHVIDASHGLLVYVDGKGRLKCERVDLMDAKNKPEQWGRHLKRRLLIRWVLVDYYSGSVVVDYRESTGETAADLVDFLHYAWSPKHEPRKWPLHGVPQILYADQGPAQKASLVGNLCERLGVRTIWHESSHKRWDAPASRATGAVESMQRVWESRFEAQWTYEAPQGGIEEIRAQARDFSVRFNSDPRFRVRGTSLTRSQLWMDIRDEQLRVATPDLDEFRRLAYGRPMPRTLDMYGRLKVDGRLYKIPDCDTWIAGEELLVSTNPWEPHRLKVTHPVTQEERWAIHTPRKRNGKTVAAAIIGEAAGDRPADIPSARQPRHVAAQLRAEAGPETADKRALGRSGAYSTHLGHHAEQPALANVDFIPRQGRPAITAPPLRRLDDLDVQELAVARLRRPLEPAEAAWITEQMAGQRLSEPEAVDLLEALAARAGQPRQIIALRG